MTYTRTNTHAHTRTHTHTHTCPVLLFDLEFAAFRGCVCVHGGAVSTQALGHAFRMLQSQVSIPWRCKHQRQCLCSAHCSLACASHSFFLFGDACILLITQLVTLLLLCDLSSIVRECNTEHDRGVLELHPRKASHSHVSPVRPSFLCLLTFVVRVCMYVWYPIPTSFPSLPLLLPFVVVQWRAIGCD